MRFPFFESIALQVQIHYASSARLVIVAVNVLPSIIMPPDLSGSRLHLRALPNFCIEGDNMQ
jgi:hypothetical protein